MSWQSSAISFLHGKSSLVMIVLMLLTKILKLDKRPTKLKESDTKRVVMNSRGMKLFMCRWLPVNGEPNALVFLCHGYGMESNISMKGQYISLSSLIVTIDFQNEDKKKHKQSTLRPGRKGTGTRLAKAGYGVYGMDYEWHGRSSGLPEYIPSFEDVVTDCSDHYTRISVEENPPHEDETTIDDLTLPTVTIRVWIMGISACVAQAFLSSRSMFQEDTLDLPFILGLNLTCCMGESMAVLLPNRSIKVPWTRGFQFSLNPGPFNWKEHTLVSLCAYLGRMRPFLLQTVSIIVLYFHMDIHFTAALFYVYEIEGVRYKEDFVMNLRGMKLFTCRWLPAKGEPKALVFLCHGYGMESIISMKGQYTSVSSLIVTIECQNGDKKKHKKSTLRPRRKGTGTRLAKAGYGVYGMDDEGHGRSSGLPGYIPSFEDVVTDCSDHYTRISERKENVIKSRFLKGESMGGTVAILLHLKKPNFWDGAVLVAPMCKVCCLPG